MCHKKGVERVVRSLALLVFSCSLRSHHKTSRAKENSGKCLRKHIVQRNLQYALPNLPPLSFFATALRSGKLIGA
jgi:hypothetical protein